MHYTLKDDQGNLIDSSEGKAPLTYIHGNGMLISGMEEGVEGKIKGDKLSLSIPPEKGYGNHNPEYVQDVPRAQFPADVDIQVGMQFNASGEAGQVQPVLVTEVKDDSITIDGNHELAGVNLNFNVEIMEVREATAEELDHGHVHGPGGHEH